MDIKKDFPIFNRKINGNEIIYLDNAATTQKPQEVIDSIAAYYSNYNANTSRGAYTLGEESTEMYENSRKIISNFINAYSDKEIVFVKNATEGLNIIANCYGLTFLQEGETILTSTSEHNSSLLPWRNVAQVKKADLDFFSVDAFGDFSLTEIEQTLKTKKVKVVLINHVSNVLGTIFPIRQISDLAHKYGAIVIVDGSQAVCNLKVNVRELGCDFYVFSGHKMFGPMGIGVLWGKESLLEKMPPFNFGGGMVKNFDLVEPNWEKLPERFEAGTQSVADAMGLATAAQYMERIGLDNIKAHEEKLTKYLIDKLENIKDLVILGPKDATKRAGLVSFYIEGVHSHDISSVLNTENVFVRSGMMCSMNLHKTLQIKASTRISYTIYNSQDDIDKLIGVLNKALGILK